MSAGVINLFVDFYYFIIIIFFMINLYFTNLFLNILIKLIMNLYSLFAFDFFFFFSAGVCKALR